MKILLFLWTVCNLFWQGFVFMKVWNWFPQEILGAPSLGLAGAMGLLLIAVFFRSINSKLEKKPEKELWYASISITVLYGFVLLIGFIIQLFI